MHFMRRVKACDAFYMRRVKVKYTALCIHEASKNMGSMMVLHFYNYTSLSLLLVNTITYWVTPLNRLKESINFSQNSSVEVGPRQGIYINRYTYQSCWNVFLRGKSWKHQQLIDLLQFQSLLICNVV